MHPMSNFRKDLLILNFQRTKNRMTQTRGGIQILIWRLMMNHLLLVQAEPADHQLDDLLSVARGGLWQQSCGCGFFPAVVKTEKRRRIPLAATPVEPTVQSNHNQTNG
ncbi:hypothetical protein ACFX2J_035149 [Malus domestica]